MVKPKSSPVPQPVVSVPDDPKGLVSFVALCRDSTEMIGLSIATTMQLDGVSATSNNKGVLVVVLAAAPDLVVQVRIDKLGRGWLARATDIGPSDDCDRGTTILVTWVRLLEQDGLTWKMLYEQDKK